MNQIILRHATPLDLKLLQYWDTQEHVIESDPDSDWNWEKELPHTPPWREQLMVELSGRPIGFIQIIDPLEEETHYWGECAPNLRAIDIWIGEKEDLVKGYGTTMMELALDRCFAEKNVTAVLIDPLSTNRRAIQFYQRCGFRFIERRQFSDSICDVHQITREEWSALPVTK